MATDECGPLQGMAAEYRLRLPEHGAAVLSDPRLRNPFADACHPLALMLAVGGEVAAVTMHRTTSQVGACVLEFASGAVGTFSLVSAPTLPLERYSVLGQVARQHRERLARHRPARHSVRIWAHHELRPGGHGLRRGGCGSRRIPWPPWRTRHCSRRASTTRCATSAIVFWRHDRAHQGSLEFTLKLMRVYEAALRSEGSRVEIG